MSCLFLIQASDILIKTASIQILTINIEIKTMFNKKFDNLFFLIPVLSVYLPWIKSSFFLFIKLLF